MLDLIWVEIGLEALRHSLAVLDYECAEVQIIRAHVDDAVLLFLVLFKDVVDLESFFIID